ncbi:MAG: pitrilysin family protein [Phycisphaerales bacterium]
MASQHLRSYTLRCGAQLAVERMPGTRSVAAVVMLPVGTAGDPAGAAGEGESTLLSELVLRGAGDLTSRQLSDAFDALGAQRHGTAAVHHLSLTTLCLGDRFAATMGLLAQVIRRPRLEEESLESVRAIALQALEGLQDEPQHLAGITLREFAMPAPFNRSGYGTKEGLESITRERIRAAWERRARPGGTIVGIAGDIEPDAARDLLERLFEGWSGATPPVPMAAPPQRGEHLVELETQQTHLALGLDAPPESDPDAYKHRVAVRVLGGAPSSRLFTEVREKRGLCYSVGATTALGKEHGLVQIYAGSTHERAPRTLECILQELERFEQGITQEEFDHALVGAKSGLVMSGESSSARAMAIATQLYRTGQPMDLAATAAEFERLTLAGVNEYIARGMGKAWREGRTMVRVAGGG